MTSDSRRVVVGAENGVTVRGAATLSVLKSFPAAGKRAMRTLPTAYALSGDDRTVAIGGADGSLRFLDLLSGTLRTASGRHRAAVNEARLTPTGAHSSRQARTPTARCRSGISPAAGASGSALRRATPTRSPATP
jgi:hypothetical protein